MYTFSEIIIANTLSDMCKKGKRVYPFVISFSPKGDVNGDGRADVVCTADGSMMVWQSKDVGQNANIYDPNSKWIDQAFGFCKLQNKMVKLLVI